jgi:hypothetical protein
MWEAAKALLEKASSPGDQATILLAGTLGFVLDAGLNVVGFLSPGYVGLTFATTALGAKKALEAKGNRGAATRQVLQKATNLRQYFIKREAAEPVELLTKLIELLEIGVVSPEQAEEGIADIVSRYS